MNSKENKTEIAIVGMACSFPRAPDLETFWQNNVCGIDAVSEVPRERWNPDRFYNPADGTRLYGKKGGYLESPFAFNPAEFGIMPKAVQGGEPDQFLVLKTAAEALRDAGIPAGGPDHERTAFILGRGSYLSAGAFNLVQRTFIADQTVDIVGRMHPEFSEDDAARLKDDLMASLAPFEAETAPSVMPNITAGRVANRLGFMGPNYTIDAACASSLYAADAAVSALVSNRSDLALAGGVHIFNNIPFLNVFCTLGAMSRQDQIRPFDQQADGMIPGEGVGIVVLKRLADAQRDGNRIYAVLRGVGTSSDGKGVSVAAPRVEGEVLALERAYELAGICPTTIAMIEAHGTATAVGDESEIKALTTVFGKKAENAPRHCALGTVKSMIGHAMPAAGIAGMIRAVLALYHKVLPPTLHCETPHHKLRLEETPFYVNTETRPWFRAASDIPRRAGLNAFGFGGVNAHVILEEYEENTPEKLGISVSELLDPPRATTERVPDSCPIPWDAVLFLLSAGSRAELAAQCRRILERVRQDGAVDLVTLSHSLLTEYVPDSERIAVVADSPEDLAGKLEYAAGKLEEDNCRKIKDIKGIYYFASPLGESGKVAFMFPGEGASYTGMMMDLCLQFPSVRAGFDEMNQAIAARKKITRHLPTQFIFPATLLTEAESRVLEDAFWKLDSGLQAILASSLAMKDLLGKFNIAPDMIVGHSAGEYSAWIASGILDRTDFYQKQEQIAAVYADRSHTVKTSMAAVSAGYEKVKTLLEIIHGDIYISNDNCPHQVVVVGEADAMEQFRQVLKSERIFYTDLPSTEVHHTPMAAGQAEALTSAFSGLELSSAQIPVYSAVEAAPYPADRDAIIDLMARYWLRTLQFRQTVEVMYNDGARIFVEVGPGNNLCGFVDDTLRGRNIMTVASNTSRRSGTAQLCHLLGMLAAQHVPVSLEPLMSAQQLRLQAPDIQANKTRGKAPLIHMDLALPELQLSDEAAAMWREKLAAPEPKRLETAESAAAAPGPKTFGYCAARAPQQASSPEKSGENSDISPKSRAMGQYMDTMSRFLELQKEITESLAGLKKGRSESGGSDNRSHAFVGKVVDLEPGKQSRVKRFLDLGEDVFLLDHPFGGDVSDTDDQLHPLIVTPLTLNMEIMAEAASLVFPGKVPVEIKNVSAGRWVVVDENNGAALEASARAITETSAMAALYERAFSDAPSARAEVVFDADYPAPEPIDSIPDCGLPRDAAEAAEQIYEQKWMTHGPKFRVIAGISQATEEQIVAVLRVPSSGDLFNSGQTADLIIHPLLMDACAQLTGYWAQQTLKERFITFPAGAGSIRFFSAPPRAGETMRARMHVREVTEHFVKSDIDIVYQSGRLWTRITGWTHLRFDLPMELYHFWRFPRLHPVSRVQQDSEGSCSKSLSCRAPYYEDLDSTIWKRAIGWLYLNRDERAVYRQKMDQEKNGARWLAERMAAKDAIRVFAKKSTGTALLPADIEIIEKESGSFTGPGHSIAGLNPNTGLSITREDGYVSAAFPAQ
ncbi:MAG: polyketide synthase dehydratase domain-containing protein [Desulfobacteraceae bacterium]|nr:polyketide synthase dehydratase domain-containing protein [Desulfobacteraceae bacterium]